MATRTNGDHTRTDRPEEGDQHRKDIPEYGRRHRGLIQRSIWFHLGRPFDDALLEEILADGYRRKREMIKEQLDRVRDVAAYNPAGAGTPWFTMGPRNINGRVKSLAVHPTNPSIVYAAGASGGIWKSIDGAQSWRPQWDEQETLVIGSVAIAPSAPDTLYVGTGEWTPGYVAAGPGAGVYVSTNGGAAWTRRAAVLARRIARILVHPTTATTVYVAGNQGFERSTDSGVTWTTLRTGEISDAVIDSVTPAVMYINVRNDGIYKTTDGGTTWSQLANGPTGAAADWVKLAIGVSGTNGTSFLLAKRSGTIYRSTDAGANWTTLAGSHGSAGHHTWANLLAAAPDDQSIILAGGVGAERTANGGTTWTALGVLHADHHVAVFAPSSTSIVYACNDGGVYRSADKGATWKKASHGLVVTQFYDVSGWDPISTVAGGGTQDQGTTMSLGGLTWRHIQNTHDGGYFLISPTDPRTMYEEYQNTVIHKSTDGGNSWVQKTGGLSGTSQWVGVLAMHPTNHDVLYTGTTEVYRTTDGCATNWVQSSQTLAGAVSSIAIARSDPNRVYAAGGGRVYRSDDAGVTNPWTDKTTATLPSGRNVTDIAVDRSDPNRIVVTYGGTAGGPAASHVFRSTNGGTTWTDISGTLPNVNVSAVALDPNSTATIYVGNDVGVFRTTDGGATWDAFDNGLPNVIITDLTVDAEDNLLIAATFGRGMYKVGIAPAASEPAVDLYLRDSVLDTGERFPSPGGVANPADLTDIVDWWESPDMKVEVTPYYTPDAVFDGVEFDEDVQHDSPERTEVNRFYLQVHNRGWQQTTNVRVRAFFADAHAGLPSLPNALTPPDFNLSSTAAWQPIGPAQTIPVLEPNRPVIVTWDWTVPAGAATHSCLLAVVSSPDDPIATTQTNVDLLVNAEKRVALKNLHVIDSAGPRPEQTMVPLKFHNAKDTDDAIDIVIQPVGMTNAILGLLLEPVDFVDAAKALVNVDMIGLRDGEDVGVWYERPGQRGDVEPSAILGRLDRSRLFDLDPAKRSELRGIRIGAKQTLQAVVTAKGSHRVPYGTEQQFSVMQRQDGRIVGGSTYVIRLRRARGLLPVSHLRVILEKIRVTDDHDPWIKGRGDITLQSVVGFGTSPDRRHRVRLPAVGEVKIGDRPGHNEYTFDACLFDGFVAEADTMRVELAPTEHDLFDPDDAFVVYRRSFSGPPETWVGRFGPDDDPGADPERMADWMVWYRIESLPLA